MAWRAAWLILLLAARPAFAFDVGMILEARRLQSFGAGPAEEVLAAGAPRPAQPALAVGRIGRRWGYFWLHETPARRVARFGPFPFARCGDSRPNLRLARFGDGGWSVAFAGCPPGTEAVWLLGPGGDVLSTDPSQPGLLTRWAGATVAPEVIAWVQAGWAAAPPRDAA
ncbi:hypothetical protein, partial [Plastoroseomonas arctica]